MFELLGEVGGRGLAGSSTGHASLGTDMDSPAQEGACSDHNAFCPETSALERIHAKHSSLIGREDKSGNSPLHSLQICLGFEKRSNRPAVKSAIALRTWCPNGWPLAAVQHSELDHRQIGRPRHDSAESIDFANYGSLRNAPDRRIARHLTDRFESTGDQAHSGTKARSSNRRLSSCVASSYNDNIEIGFKILRSRHTFKIKRRVSLS